MAGSSLEKYERPNIIAFMAWYCNRIHSVVNSYIERYILCLQMLTGDQCDSGSVENTPADASEITPDDEPSAESFNYSKDNSDSLVYKIIPN